MQCADESTAASSPSVSLIASRIGWSSALRLAGLEIVSRTTPGEGSSIRSLPSASCSAGGEADIGGQGTGPLLARGAALSPAQAPGAAGAGGPASVQHDEG